MKDFQSLEVLPRLVSKDWKPRKASRGRLWREALSRRAVWSRALLMGATVGALQVAINQGDHWLHHAVDGAVIAKTIACPLVTVGVALFAAASTYVENERRKIE